jgi:DNA primase
VEAVGCEEVVRAYVALDRRGVGHCPWPEHHAHGDRSASFQVLGRAQRWICYATGETGNAFDFVCRMEALTPRAALAYCQERWPVRARDGPSR